MASWLHSRMAKLPEQYTYNYQKHKLEKAALLLL